MRNKTWLVNIFLAAGILMMCAEIYGVWNTAPDEIRHVRGEAEGEPHKKRPEQATATDIGLNTADRIGKAELYNAMVTKNLFSPERKGKLPQPESDPANANGGATRKSGTPVRLALYGTIVTDQYKAVLINNPYEEDGENKNKWLRTGESIGGGDSGARITIDEIYENYAVVTIDSERHELYLHKKKDAGPVTVMQSPGSESRPDSKKNNPGNLTDKNETSADGEYKIIDTPFGKIKRRIR